MKKSGFKRSLASLAIATTLAVGAWLSAAAPLDAAGETRTLSMFHIHTKESITVTYMRNGRYIPSEMKKINYFMRDWRKNAVVTIDPKTIDLMWELHSDLGSKAPIHVVCGLRTGKTNALLKRIGRNVAKKSQHTKGKAIDFYFPDVPTKKMRNSALVRRVGGVGYYRSSAGPTGFLHLDSARVRYWGPGISKNEWASIMRDGRKTIGRRLSRTDNVAVASSGEEKKGGFLNRLFGKKQPTEIITAEEPVPQVEAEEDLPPIPNYAGFDDDLADLAEDAGKSPKVTKNKILQVQAEPVEPEFVPDAAIANVPVAEAKPKKKPNGGSDGVANAQLAALSQTAATEQAAEGAAVGQAGAAPVKAPVKQAGPVPKPRAKPMSIKNLAVASIGDLLIEPASAEPDSQLTKKRPSPVDSKLTEARVAALLAEEQAAAQAAAAHAKVDERAKKSSDFADGKSDFAAEIRDGNSEDAPIIRTAMANATEENVLAPVDQLIRQNGAPQSLETEAASVLPEAAAIAPAASVAGDVNSEGKGDMVLINRDGKGNMEELPEGQTKSLLKLGQLDAQ